ncbi:MAG: Gfo/Idh/MocA family oxidoreductase [bacterium]|nr:Gfo/Idh/MocA family oxidoreductase [bacterium]
MSKKRSMKVKVGIIGCGAIVQRVQLPKFKACKEAEVVAVADSNEKVAKQVAAEFGVPHYYTDWKELIARGDIDAVSIATPNYLHAPMTIAAANAKKHVLVEKPITVSMRDAHAMISAAKKNNVYLMVEQVHRFRPHHEVAKELIESGIIGKITSIRGYFGHMGPEFWSPTGKWFFSKTEAVGGAMADLGIHAIDTIRYILGKEVKQVAAFIGTLEKKIEIEDNGVCILQFTDETFGTLAASWTYKPGSMQYTFYGTKGTMWVGAGLKYDKPIVIETIAPSGILLPDIPAESKFGNPYQYFVNCILKQEEPFVNGEEGAKSLEVILAAYKSSREKRFVELPLPRK